MYLLMVSHLVILIRFLTTLVFKVIGDVECNLGTANCRGVKEAWAVLTDTPLSLQTFQLYGKRFGGIEPRFKDYKSGTFDILRSKIRDAKALSNLLMMIEILEKIVFCTTKPNFTKLTVRDLQRILE
jgi:hypothetical protein